MKKKIIIITPLIIAMMMFLCYLTLSFSLMIADSNLIPIKLFSIALLSYLIFTLVQVTKERLHEIKNEDDDLHKYES